MSTTVKTGWLNDKSGEKFAPKTLVSQVQTSDGVSLNSLLDEIQAEANIQSDWNQTDSTKADYIKNKPDIPDALADLTSDSSHRTVTDAEKATWNAKSNFSGSYNDLTNKPTIPSISGLATESYVDDIASTKVDKVSGKGLSTNDYTTTEKNKLSGIASGAEVNQNAFSNVVVGSTTIAADSKTDSLTIAAGTGISVSGDATNDKVTITNSGVRSITTGSANGTISVNTNGTSADVAVKGLGSAAYTNSSAYDAAGTAQTKADSALSSAKSYTDTKISNLINSAPTTLDTLGEIAAAMEENADVVDALEDAIGTKANASDLTSHTGNKSNPHGVTKAQVGLGNVENKSSATIRGELTKANVTTALGYTPPTTDTTYGAAGSSLGLVKSGGDVTISSGVITVNDDSHNHVISNVDGLQDALNGKVNANASTTADLNTVTTSGFYRLSSSNANSPCSNGQLLVIHGGGDTITQIAGSYSTGDLYTRSGNVINNPNGKWTEWAKVVTSNNADSVSWTAITQGLTWSRICSLTSFTNVVGCSGILSVGAVRGNVVMNATFAITASHSKSVFITQLNANGYSPFKIRGVTNQNATIAYIEIYDNAKSIASGTEQTWYCKFIPLLDCTLTKYTAFTTGATIPDGYAAGVELTVDTSGGSMVASKFVGDLSGTATKATQDAAGNTITSTYATNTALGNKVDKAIMLNACDLNDVVTSGFYRFTGEAADYTNRPMLTNTSCSYAQMIVSRGGDTIVQMIFPYQNNEIAIRSGSGIGGSSPSWREWKRVVNNDNIESLLPTVPIAKGGTGATTAAGALTNLGITTSTAALNSLGGVCRTITDWNDATSNGWYMGYAATNAPDSTNWYFGHVIAHNSLYIFQEVYHFANHSAANEMPKYVRACRNGTWGNWTNVTVETKVDTDDIAKIAEIDGKVSKSGGVMSGGLTLANCSNLTLRAASSSSDPGDIIFEDGSGNEIGRIWKEAGGAVFNVRFGGDDTSKQLIHSENIGSQSVKYATSAGSASTATTATKLGTDAGSATQPVYFSGGKPVATTYTLGKSVPSDAKFTDTTYSNMTAATASAAGKAGLVPAPAAGKQTSFLRGDGTWVVPTNTTYSNFVKSGSGAKAGLVPAPSTTAGTTKYLREDGTWAVPPDTNTTYSAASQSAAGLMSAADKKKLDGIASGATANTGDITGVTAGAGLGGGGTSGTVTLTNSGVRSITQDSTDGHKLTINTGGTSTTITIPDSNTTYSAATQSAQGLMSAADKKKLDGITESADSVSFSRSLTSGTKVGTITINGTGTDLYAPKDTHYATSLYVGRANTTFVNESVENPYIKLYDDRIERSKIRLVGSGATTVKSDTSGNITISSTDTNTTYPIYKMGMNALAIGDIYLDYNFDHAGDSSFMVNHGSVSYNEDMSSTTHTQGYPRDAFAANSSVAGGDYAFACGRDSSAYGENSFAAGYSNCVASYNSAAFGEGNYVESPNALFCGTWSAYQNVGYFVVGKGGSEAARSNAFRVTSAGKCMGTSSFVASGADYAEYYEWIDGNPDNEDRRGYFVTLDGTKIRMAMTDDDYILGVISGAPAVIGNGYTDEWNGMYLKDIFGEYLTETVEVEETTDKNGVVIPAHTETRLVLNPEYDSTQKYIGRDQRKEWAPVGTHGQLVVIDDGTCEVNGYCKVVDGGTATKADDKTEYRVTERLDDTHIRITIK